MPRILQFGASVAVLALACIDTGRSRTLSAESGYLIGVSGFSALTLLAHMISECIYRAHSLRRQKLTHLWTFLSLVLWFAGLFLLLISLL